MGYSREVVKGVSWIGLLRFSTKAIGFFEAVILARILAPDAFGAYGVALLGLGILEVITETGVNIVLIQEDNVDAYVSSAWVVSVLRGTLIMLLIIIATPYIADFFNSPKSLMLLYMISVAPFLRGFINPAVVKLQKNLLFKRDFWYRSMILIVDTTFSIVITYLTKNPVGIVVGFLAGVLAELSLSYFIVSPLPGLSVKKEYISKLINRGKWVTGSGLFDYLFFNLDNISVGRILGTTFLGIYQLAYSLSVVPMTELSNVFIHVTFPIFTRISEDTTRLKKGYIKTVMTIFLMVMPLVLVLVFLPQIFVFILGEKWSKIASILPILGVLGLVKSLSGSSSALFLSEKKQQYTMMVTLVTIVAMAVSLIPLIHLYGMFGAGMAALIGSVVSLPLTGTYVYRIFQKNNVDNE